MISTPAIQNLIRENKSYRIVSAIQTGHKYGMNLLDEHLLALYRKNIISYKEGVTRAQMPEEFEESARAVGGGVIEGETGPEEMASVLDT